MALTCFMPARTESSMVAWQWVRPDHVEMMFAIGARVHLVAFPSELLHRGFVQVGERGMQFTFPYPKCL